MNQGTTGRKAFWAAVALQLAVVQTGAAYKYWQRSKGKEVKVQTAAVDPRSPMRGDYVVLRYPFADQPVEGGLPRPEGSGPLRLGERVWVELGGEGPGGTRVATRVSDRPFPAGPQLQGRADRTEYRAGRHVLVVDFGIDAWFVEEGTGKDLEDRARRGALTATLSVLPDGRAMLVGVE